MKNKRPASINKTPQQTAYEVEMQQRLAYFEGPLPAPDVLEKYNVIYPDSVETIFKMTKDFQDHVIKMDQEGAKANKMELALTLLIGFTGQISVLIVALAGFVFAYARPELGGHGFWFSAVACGYLIWWKTHAIKKAEKEPTD